MTAASPFRWFLSLLALFTPVAVMTDRTPDAPERSTVQQRPDVHVVFRHYL